MKKKVFVGLSGGVDSSVAALKLKNDGYDVTGIFMKNWSGEDYGISENCPWEEDLESAKRVAEHLGIPLKVYNFEKEYRKLVIEEFFEEYRSGNTPNPDVLCNQYIKFDRFLEKAVEDGADYIATGHYAKTKDGKLFNAKDGNKDQTYFLHMLTKQQLEKSRFPLGNLKKDKVREVAAKNNIPSADRPDSQGICFVGKVDMEEFLQTEISTKKGNIVDIDNKKKLGKHNGIAFYTIGQRKGLKIGGSPEPYFVARKDVDKNILYVARGRKHPELWKKKLELEDIHMISGGTLKNGSYRATIRYRAKAQKARIEGNAVTFKKPVWAPAIGQSVVIYKGRECLGGGKISKIS